MIPRDEILTETAGPVLEGVSGGGFEYMIDGLCGSPRALKLSQKPKKGFRFFD